MTTSESQIEPTHSTLKADAALIAVAFIWGINIPLMKNGLDELGDWVFNGLRLVVSAVVLVLFALAERKRKVLPSPDLSWKKVLIFGLCVSGLYQVLFLLGIARSSSGNTALIICTIPIWTSLLARIFIKERLSLVAWAGLLLGLVGTVVVAWQKQGGMNMSRQLTGDLFILASAITWSACTVYSRPLMAHISPLQLSAVAAVVALPIHVIGAVNGFQTALPLLSRWDIWLIILYSGILSSGLALPLWNYGVRHAGASHAAVVQNLVPVVAMHAAWITRNQVATSAQIFGGILIIAGLFVMRSGRPKKLTVETPAFRSSAAQVK